LKGKVSAVVTRDKGVELIDVNSENVSETGFFCYMSKRKSEGYRRKLDWLRARFDEGLRIKLLRLPERGFIEYIPGEYAWRAVHDAQGYMLIHCIWVAGRSKGKGYGGLLVERCIKDAKRAGMRGIAMVTSEGNWLAGNELLLHHGFVPVDRAPPSFTLMVRRFSDAPPPSFPKDWQERLGRFSEGLTILRSDQCPYIENATHILLDAAKERRIRSRVIELKNCAEAKKTSPSPYGVFNVVHRGRLLSYHMVGKDKFSEFVKMNRD